MAEEFLTGCCRHVICAVYAISISNKSLVHQEWSYLMFWIRSDLLIRVHGISTAETLLSHFKNKWHRENQLPQLLASWVAKHIFFYCSMWLYTPTLFWDLSFLFFFCLHLCKRIYTPWVKKRFAILYQSLEHC